MLRMPLPSVGRIMNLFAVLTRCRKSIRLGLRAIPRVFMWWVWARHLYPDQIHTLLCVCSYAFTMFQIVTILGRDKVFKKKNKNRDPRALGRGETKIVQPVTQRTYQRNLWIFLQWGNSGNSFITCIYNNNNNNKFGHSVRLLVFHQISAPNTPQSQCWLYTRLSTHLISHSFLIVPGCRLCYPSSSFLPVREGQIFRKRCFYNLRKPGTFGVRKRILRTPRQSCLKSTKPKWMTSVTFEDFRLKKKKKYRMVEKSRTNFLSMFCFFPESTLIS